MQIIYYTVSVTNMETGETQTEAYLREKPAIAEFYRLCNHCCYSTSHIKPVKHPMQYMLAGGPGYDLMFELNHKTINL